MVTIASVRQIPAPRKPAAARDNKTGKLEAFWNAFSAAFRLGLPQGRCFMIEVNPQLAKWQSDIVTDARWQVALANNLSYIIDTVEGQQFLLSSQTFRTRSCWSETKAGPIDLPEAEKKVADYLADFIAATVSEAMSMSETKIEADLGVWVGGRQSRMENLGRNIKGMNPVGYGTYVDFVVTGRIRIKEAA